MRTNYNKRFDSAYPGMIRGMGNQPGISVQPYTNSSGGQLEQWTVGITDDPAANTLYELNVDGTLISYQTGAATTQVQLLEGLNVAFRSNMEAGSKFNLEIIGTDLVFTVKTYEDRRQISVISGTKMVATKTIDASKPELIEYGVILVRKPGDKSGTATLPTGAADERSVGFTRSTIKEWNSLDPNAKPGYEANQVMDVCDRTNGAQGGMLKSIESDLKEGDPVYYSYAPGTKGWITKSPVNATDISAIASIQQGTVKYQGENYLTCVRYNQV